MQVGKYELLSKLATGGMAEVFLARAAGPMGFEKTLVLKRILPHLAEDPSFVAMFLGEARLAAQLNHPHIVQIFDFGEAKGEYFLAMEYIDGPNLRVLLKRARSEVQELAPALCARIVSSACEGLAFAHDFRDPASGNPLGLVHRDISTDNILVSRQGAVKVVDFGIAKAAGQSHKTQTGIIKGKVAYMPPEQIRAEELDRRVDVYALGVVLYELLTGHKPFDAPTEASLMQAILFESQVPASDFRPDLPKALLHILDRALARDRAQRYPDCRAFQSDLEDFIVSTGKAVGAYQLSQLVAQLLPPTEMLPASSRPSVEAVTQPTHKTPATAPAPDTLSSEKPTLESVTPRPRLVAPTPDRRPLAIPALVAAALLIAGGGYVLGMRSGRTAPETVATAPVTPLAPTTPPVQPTSAPKPPEAQTTAGNPTPTQTPTEAVAAQGPQPSDEQTGDRAARTERPEDRKTPSRPSHPPALRRNRGQDASRMGTLHLTVRGWAEIWVDGKKQGRVPPLNELELSAGRHELKLINPSAKPYKATITIPAGGTLEHQVVFQSAGATESDASISTR